MVNYQLQPIPSLENVLNETKYDVKQKWIDVAFSSMHGNEIPILWFR